MKENVFLDAARQGKNSFWRYLLTLTGVVVAAFGASALLLFAALASRAASVDLAWGTVSFESDTVGLLVNMLPFAFVLFWLWFALRLLHRRPFITLVNPLKTVRWDSLFLSAGLWFLLSALGDGLMYLLNPGNYAWTFQPARFFPFLLLSLVLIPIQTSTEELVFRGYLTQGLGRMVRNFWVLLIVPAVLFGLLHSANPEVSLYGFGWMMASYIGIGLLLSFVTLRSQGLELALGLHFANNLYAVFSTFPGSAIQTPALVTVRSIDPRISFLVLVIMSAIYLTLLSLIRRGRVWNLVLLAVLLLSGCSPLAPSASPSRYGIPLSDCRLSMPGVALQVPARCGKLSVYEDRAAGSGRKIDLRVAVIPATSQNPAKDPLFLLAGGPGQASTEAFVPLISDLDRIRFKRDLVLVDQRGTGQSNGLRCPTPPRAEGYISGQNVSLDQQVDELQACLRQLKGDPHFYTTEIATRDLEDVRKALGYGQINLLGVSYGTRAALAYLQLFPQNVRSVVLDSVVPPAWSLGDFTSRDAQRAFDLMVKRCQDAPACRETFPNLASEFAGLLRDLEQYPVDVQLPDPLTGENTSAHLSRATVLITVRMMLYSTETTALLPLIIHKAYAEGDMKPLAAQYLLISQSLNESMSDGMYLSVICAEDVPFYAAEPPGPPTLFDYSRDEVKTLCQNWPHGPASDALRQPVQSDVPALLLSGSADPVTPPSNSQQVAAGLTNSREIVVEGLGHNVMYRGCLPRLIGDFLESGSAQNLDTTCVQAVQPLPFFLSFSGPKP